MDHTDIIQILLENNANINAVNSNGVSALWWAGTFCNQKKSAWLKLVSTISNKHRSGFLFISAFMGKEKSAKILCENGADISVTSRKGNSICNFNSRIGFLIKEC